MAVSDNAIIYYESGQTSYPQEAMADSGDATTFNGSVAGPWSLEASAEPVVLPNGVLEGGNGTPTATNNQIAVSAVSLNLNGVVTSVAGGNVTAARGSTNGYKISSVTVNAAGSLAVVAGTEHTASSETRGANGGPPYIPTDSVELFQVRYTSTTAAPVLAAEIYDSPGLHRESADSPVYRLNTTDAKVGQIVFSSALPLVHTGDVPKAVFITFATPIFSEIDKANAWVPPEDSFSLSSSPIYGGTVTSTSRSTSQGSFTAFLKNGITDAIATLSGKILWFKFLQDRNKTPYQLVNGKVGLTRSFPADNQVSAAITISSDTPPFDIAS